MADNTIWYYTIYRNSDDRILCFDVPLNKAAEIMGWKPMSLRQMYSRSKGRMPNYTITRRTREEILRDMEADD